MKVQFKKTNERFIKKPINGPSSVTKKAVGKVQTMLNFPIQQTEALTGFTSTTELSTSSDVQFLNMHMDTEPQSPPQLETILQSPPIQPSYQIDEQALADTLFQDYDITFSQTSLKIYY